jgi:hypothetical protein
MSRSRGTADNPRRLMWLAAFVYTAFVIYGSLVPLEFRALPWDEAVAQFRAIPFLQARHRFARRLGGQPAVVHPADLFVDGRAVAGRSVAGGRAGDARG